MMMGPWWHMVLLIFQRLVPTQVLQRWWVVAVAGVLVAVWVAVLVVMAHARGQHPTWCV